MAGRRSISSIRARENEGQAGPQWRAGEEKLWRTGLDHGRSQQGVTPGAEFGALPGARRTGLQGSRQAGIWDTGPGGRRGWGRRGKGGKCIFRVPIISFTLLTSRESKI